MLPQDSREPTLAHPEVAPIPTQAHSSRLPTADGNLPAVPGYEILSVLGRGGMGVVYRARHLALGRTVALKMILAGGHAGPDDLARFKLEAEAAAQLQHPGVVQVFEVGEHAGRPYCALEYVEGGSLAELLLKGPLPPRRAAEVVEALAQALQLAHARNVIHRDLKPANVLLTGAGTPKVTDFGLARRLDAEVGHTQTGALLGTPGYMAPEQAAGQVRAVGPAADIHALGAILYECLTGRPPFHGATLLETLEQVSTREPAPPRSLVPAIPRDMETICLKCLRKEPERRYPSAADLAADLARFLAGEPVTARPVGFAERTAMWARRRPAVAVLLGVTSLALLLLIAGLATGVRLLADRQSRLEEALGREKEQGVRLAQAAYFHRITQADRALSGGDFRRAARLLEECPENLRAWEWNHLSCRTEGEMLPLVPGPAIWVGESTPAHPFFLLGLFSRTFEEQREKKDPLRVCWSSQDTLHALVTGPESPRIIEVTSGRTCYRLGEAFPGRALGRDLLAAAVAPGGKRVAVATGKLSFGPPERGEEKVKTPVRLTVWDAEADRSLWGLEVPGPALVRPLFSPDGKLLALAVSGRDDKAEKLPGKVRLLDAADGRERLVIPSDPSFLGVMPNVVFSRDGRRLAVLPSTAWPRQGRGEVWDISAGRKLCSFEGSFLHTVFSPDGSLLASADNSTDAASIIVRDAATGETRHVLQHAGASAAFAPSGRLLATASHAGVRIWEVNDGKVSENPLHQFKPELEGIEVTRDVTTPVVCSFSPDGRRLLLSTRERSVVVDALTAKVLLSVPRAGLAEFGPGGARIVGGGELGAGVWDLTTRIDPVYLPPWQDGRDSAFSERAGLSAFASGRDIRLTDERRQPVGVLAGHTFPVRRLHFSPSGASLVTVGSGKEDEVVLWNVAERRAVRTLRPRPGESLTDLGFTPDSSRLVVALRPAGRTEAREAEAHQLGKEADLPPYTLLTLDTTTGKELRRVPFAGWLREGVMVANSGRIVREGDGIVEIYDAVTGRKLWGNHAPGTSVVTGPGAGLLAVIRQVRENRMMRIRLLDGETGEERAAWEVPGGWQVAFRPDGKALALWSSDEVGIWDTRGKQRQGWAVSGRLHWVAWSPDGSRLATVADQRFRLTLWDPESGTEVVEVGSPTDRRDFHAFLAHPAFSPDGSLLTLTWPIGGRMWDGGPRGPAADETRRTEMEERRVRWHLGQAEDAVTQMRRPETAAVAHEAAVFHLERVSSEALGRTEELTRRVGVAAGLGRWNEAAKDYVRAGEVGNLSATDEHRRALLALRMGDAELYRTICRDLMGRFGPSAALRTCVLGPGAVNDYGPLLPHRGEFPHADRLALLYRSGDLAGAGSEADAVTVEKALPARAWLYVALTRHKQGKTEEARKARTEAGKAPVLLFGWDDRLEVELLKEEVETQLGKEKPGG
jgi:WD40 repeat protein